MFRASGFALWLGAASLTAVFMCSPARAGDVGIYPLPKDMDHLTLESYLEALQLNTQAGSKGVFNTPRWTEMEPKKGTYVLDGPLGGALHAIATEPRSQIYLGVQMINTTNRETPADLSARAWDDPVVLARFDALLAKIQQKYGTVMPAAVSLGNEVDVYFSQHPDELPAFLSFLAKAKPLVHKYFPDVRVGTTVTFEGLKKGREKLIASLLEQSDIAIFTYYPVIDFVPLPLSETSAHVADMIKAAKGKKLVLQEIGYPASNSGAAGETAQADFCKTILPLVQSNPHIEAGFIFALHDISPNLCDGFMSYYKATEWGEENVRKFKDFLCTLGLRRSDGTPRPAYAVVKDILTTP